MNSRIRLRMSSSISVMSDRLTSGSTSRSVRPATSCDRGSWNRHPLDDVLDHRVGGQAVAGGVRARARCGGRARTARDPGCLPGYTSSRRAHEQRPDLGEPAPADDRARRGAEIDAASRPAPTASGGASRCRGCRGASPRPGAGCSRPSRSCRNTCSVIARAQLDDALLRHQRVQPDLLEVEVDQLLLLPRAAGSRC